MCVAVAAIAVNSEYPLIILHNRDEFFSRESRPAAFWQETKSIYSGQDMLGGGTWFGCNKQGGFALITNYRDLSRNRSGMPSRGEIVANYLMQSDPGAFAVWLKKHRNRYNPFNVIYGNPGEVYYSSDEHAGSISLGAGLYGLSNARLDTPWFKLERAKALFNERMEGSARLDRARLIQAFLDEKRCPPALLPETGISQDDEYRLSSIFITGTTYGTRATSLMTLDRHGKLDFEEVLHTPLSKCFTRNAVSFAITGGDQAGSYPPVSIS